MSGPSLQPTQSNHVRYQGSYSPSFPTHSKFLGGAGENDLAAQQASWYQEAYAYYNAVAAGEIERPSEEQWNEFLNQMNWVYSQLNGYSGGDTSDVGFDGEQGFSEQSRGPAINEFGGVEGPNQNWVYDSPESEITAQPDGMRHDVYGFTNTLNVPSASGKVTHEITSDGLEPAGRVLKVVVTTAQGESVYYYHNWESPDFKLDIKVPQTSQVTGSADLGTHLKVSKLSDRTGPAQDRPPASIEGEDQGDGTTYYEAPSIDQTIDFYPQGDETEVNYVVGNANISVPLSSSVSVKKSTVPGYDYAVMVTDKDGVVKTYHVKKEFKVNLNAMKENVVFITEEFTDDEGGSSSLIRGNVPEEFKEVFTINGGDNAESSSIEAQGDSNFTTDEDGNRTWDGSTFDIYTRKDGKTGNVYARNDVTLHASSNQEYWTVEWRTEPPGYEIKVYTDSSKSELKETIFIDDMVDNIKLDVDPSRIEFLGDLGKEFDPHQINTGWETAQRLSFVDASSEGESSQNTASSTVATSLADIDGIEKTPEEILTAASDQNPPIDLSFPPVFPGDLLSFLLAIDPRLGSLLDQFKRSSGEARSMANRAICNRMITLLKVFYPEPEHKIELDDRGWGVKFDDEEFYVTNGHATAETENKDVLVFEPPSHSGGLTGGM